MEHLVEGVVARLEGDSARALLCAVVAGHHHGRGGDVASRGCDGIFLEFLEGLARKVVEVNHRVLVVVGDRVHVPFAAVHSVELLLGEVDRVEPVGACVYFGRLAQVSDLHDDRLGVLPLGVVEEDGHLLYLGLLLVRRPCDGDVVHVRDLYVERKAHRKPLHHFFDRVFALATGQNGRRHKRGYKCLVGMSHHFNRLIKGYSVFK